MSIVRVEIITSHVKLEDLKKAVSTYGVSGMTVTKVQGCGVQKGTMEYESKMNEVIELLPKDLITIFLEDTNLEDFLENIKKDLYTGHIGDGKIFVTPVSHVIRIRTGEEDYDALV